MASVTPVSSYSVPVLWHPEPLGVPCVPIYLWGCMGYIVVNASTMLFTNTSFVDDFPPTTHGYLSL